MYPEALSTMPVAPLWSILFFLMMISLGLSSMVSCDDGDDDGGGGDEDDDDDNGGNKDEDEDDGGVSGDVVA